MKFKHKTHTKLVFFWCLPTTMVDRNLTKLIQLGRQDDMKNLRGLLLYYRTFTDSLLSWFKASMISPTQKVRLALHMQRAPSPMYPIMQLFLRSVDIHLSNPVIKMLPHVSHSLFIFYTYISNYIMNFEYQNLVCWPDGQCVHRPRCGLVLNRIVVSVRVLNLGSIFTFEI